MSNDSHRLPERTRGLEVREFDDEFVVLDPITQRAHAIHGPVAEVWRAAGDGTWPDLPDEQVEEIVAELAELGLLKDTGPVVQAGISRRLLLKAGAAGGVALVGLATLDVTPAFASVILNISNNGTVTILAGATTNYTLIGGGAGAGGGAVVSGGNTSGGAGGNGGVVTGTIKNTGTSSVQLKVNLANAGAGRALNGGHGNHANGTPASGSDGNNGMSPAGGGGGGAGSSQIAEVAAGSPVLVVAAGGGGGGGAAASSGKDGGAGGSPGNTAATAAVTGNGQGGGPGTGTDDGGGGGGGGPNPGTNGGSGSSVANTPGGGGGGGTNYFLQQSGIVVTVNPAAPPLGLGARVARLPPADQEAAAVAGRPTSLAAASRRPRTLPPSRTRVRVMLVRSASC